MTFPPLALTRGWTGFCRQGYFATVNRDRASTRHSCARAAAASYGVEPKPTRPDKAVLLPRM
jgi:hypothetical protein